MNHRRRHDAAGSAVPEFVLVLVVFIPLVLGIIHVGLVLHVRNTVTTAASDGARAGAPLGATPDDAARRTRELIGTAISTRYASHVTASDRVVDGVPVVAVRVEARVPALGLFGPAVTITAVGHAVEQEQP